MAAQATDSPAATARRGTATAAANIVNLPAIAMAASLAIAALAGVVAELTTTRWPGILHPFT